MKSLSLHIGAIPATGCALNLLLSASESGWLSLGLGCNDWNKLSHRIDLVSYETVTLRDRGTATQFLNMVAQKPPTYFATAVRNLCLLYFVTTAQAAEILSACVGVTQLACWVNQRSSPELPLVVGRLAFLRHLSIEFRNFLNIMNRASSPTFFPELTHLDLIFWAPEHTEIPPDIHMLIESVGRLPRLTHLAVSFNIRNSQVSADLVSSSLPNLTVVYISEDDDNNGSYFSSNLRVADIRRTTVPNEWEASNLGDNNIWIRAERILAEKRALIAAANGTREAA